jgi:hypothetical protein
LPEGFYQVVRDAQGQLWAADQGRAVALRNGKETMALERRPSNKTERPGPLVSGRNGQLWFVGETIRNLTTGVEFRDRQIYDRFQPTASYEDTRGHFWVAKLGQGLVEWIPEPSWERCSQTRLSAVRSAWTRNRPPRPETRKCNPMEIRSEGERPILIDFGIASLRGTENRMWNTTLLGGSLHYMAPERLTGHYS